MAEFTNQELYIIGKKQKLVIWLILLALVSSFFYPISIIVGIVYIFQAYALTKALKYKNPVLWAIAIFIPIVSPVCLLIISTSATRVLRSKGIKVGFMGVNKNQLNDLYQSSTQNIK